MGIFRKLFTADPVALEEKGDALVAEGDFGSAKLTYEKAMTARPENEREGLAEKVRTCIDGIARQRIGLARKYLTDGAIELASQELEGALEVAATDVIRREAQALLDGLEAVDAQEQAVSEEMTDEERLALIAGQWQDEQADEYERYGQPLFDALVAMQSERFTEALAALEALADEAPEPRYLWLEIGRARLLTEDPAGGKAALERFLAALEDGEGGDTKLAACFALARLADDAGDFEGAVSHFEAAIHSMPDDYRPYLTMGAFLRNTGHHDEALEVLQTALDLGQRSGTDWRLLEELGLAHEEAGKTEEARTFLEQVVEFFTQRQETDLPPATATTLAALHERDGNLERAADLYRALSEGHDRDNHGRYHFEAGRLLQKIGLADEAHRMLTRAQALAGDDDQLGSEIAALLQ